MSALLNPHLASCAYCPWELACSSAAEKQRREAVHSEHAHMTTAAVTGLVAADPSHAADMAEVVAAIELDARANNGEVDPNRVRLLLPSWVQPTVIGATYNTLIRQGRLVQVGWTTNKDHKGRNAGRPAALYELRDARSEAS